MSISVVDLQNEAVEEEQPVVETIEEEAKEAIDTFVANEVVEETNNPPKEAPKEEVKEKPKRQTQKDKIQCPKCLKEVSIKTYKYFHEKICQGQLSERPVKHHAKPKPKPKIATQEIYEEEEAGRTPATSREAPPQTVIRQQPPPIVNPLTNIQQPYQLLQQQYMKQKQENYNNLCQNMFKTKLKKR